MSIKLRNHAESEDFAAGAPGTLTTASLGSIFLAPFPFVLRGIMARLGTAGGTQATIVDVLKSAQGGAFTTIFSTGTKITFATSSQTPTYSAFTTNPTTFLKGDLLKITVTQVGSAPAPADLGLSLVFQRFKNSGLVAVTVTDGLGQENE